MNIRLLTNVSFAMGVYETGAELDCEIEEAESLITMGLAEALETAPESAMLGGAKERATLPRAKARG